MPSALRIAPLFLIPVLAALAIHAEASDPSPFNIVWDRPSANSSESMPAGGRDTGLNVWVEAGELLIYVQRSGSIAENNEYLKLGRLRLKLTPNPFAEGRFRQELILREGRIEIAGDLETGGKTEPVTVQVWAEVARPVVHVEISAGSEIDVLASYENWRRSRELIPDTDRRRSTFTLDKYPGEVWLGEDTVSHQGDKVLFFHRNPDQGLLPDLLIRQQGLEEHREKIANDLSGRTFGGLVGGVGFRAAGTSEGKYQATPFQAWHLSSRQAARRHHLRLVSHVAQKPHARGLARRAPGAVERVGRGPGSGA